MSVVQLPVKKVRQTYTAETAVFHTLRVYGPVSLGELGRRMVEVAANANRSTGPLTPVLSPRQVSDALARLARADFVRFDRSSRLWKTVNGSTVPARWRNTFRSTP